MFSSFQDGQHKLDRGLLLSRLLLGSGVLPTGVYDRFDAYIRRLLRPEIFAPDGVVSLFSRTTECPSFVLQGIFLYLVDRLALWHLHVDSRRQHD